MIMSLQEDEVFVGPITSSKKFSNMIVDSWIDNIVSKDDSNMSVCSTLLTIIFVKNHPYCRKNIG